jgi:hypothetical protein
MIDVKGEGARRGFDSLETNVQRNQTEDDKVGRTKDVHERKERGPPYFDLPHLAYAHTVSQLRPTHRRPSYSLCSSRDLSSRHLSHETHELIDQLSGLDILRLGHHSRSRLLIRLCLFLFLCLFVFLGLQGEVRRVVRRLLGRRPVGERARFELFLGGHVGLSGLFRVRPDGTRDL